MNPHDIRKLVANTTINELIHCSNVDLPELDLSGCKFTARVEFIHCAFEGPLKLRGAEFLSDVFFRKCTFRGAADFTAVRFAGECNFRGSSFQGLADFYRAKIEGPAFFRPLDEQAASRVHFHGKARFRDTHFFGEANFTGALFHNDADFTRVRIDGPALFRPGDQALTLRVEFHHSERPPGAEPRDEVTFRGARFGSEASFTRCLFDARLNFNAVKADVYLMFVEAEFLDVATFRETSTPTVFFQKIEGNKPQDAIFKNGIDARGFKYERIFVDREKYTKLLEENPSSGTEPGDLPEGRGADRQPFLQFENALRRMGHDHEADRIYLARQRQERRAFWSNNDWARYLVSWLHWVLANYGITPYQLLVIPTLFLALGTLVFVQDGAVMAKPEPGEKVQDAGPIKLDVNRAFGVSVSQFLPVEIPVGVWYKPTRNRIGASRLTFDVYASIHHLVGWIYIPLTIGFFAGLFRREAPKPAAGGGGGE